MTRAVRLPSLALEALGVRERGIPTGTFIGRCWRSEVHDTMCCILPERAKPGMVRIECRPLVLVDSEAEAWVPMTWRRAAAAYCRQWPASADHVAWFALLSEDERRARLETLIERGLAEMKAGDRLDDALAGLPDRIQLWAGMGARL